MQNQNKQNQILDALQALLRDKNIQNISVSEIAQAAGIGKGSIYYYFPSKDSILDALVERNYEKPLETAKNLARRPAIPPSTGMAVTLEACRNSPWAFRAQETPDADAKEDAFIRQKYMKHLISEMKPVLTEIIRQGISQGQIRFDYPAALAEIVLIVLTVKLDNAMAPSDPRETEETILGLISLLEKGTENPAGSLNFLMTW